MFRFFCIIITLICMDSLPASTAEIPKKIQQKKKIEIPEKPEAEKTEKKRLGFTQKDLAQTIITYFSWANGLPKDATDRDYYVILSGKRNFRYEAENAYNVKTDRLTVRNFDLFGSFTGRGWLMGTSVPTLANFTILLPIGGDYTLIGTVKGRGFLWKVGDRELQSAVASGRFLPIKFGSLSLKPGVIPIKLTLPIDGAIDSFALVAPDYRPIQPFTGWRFREPLTAMRLAEVGVAMMDQYQRLPDEQRNPIKPIEAVDSALPAKFITPTDIKYLGSFSSKKWLQADYHGGTLQIPIRIAEVGFYNLRMRVIGNKIEGDVNGLPYSIVPATQSLVMTELGFYRLEPGDTMLTVKLPPMGGIDVVELTRKDTSPSEFMKLGGMTGDPERLMTADETLTYIKKISETHPVRK